MLMLKKTHEKKLAALEEENEFLKHELERTVLRNIELLTLVPSDTLRGIDDLLESEDGQKMLMGHLLERKVIVKFNKEVYKEGIELINKKQEAELRKMEKKKAKDDKDLMRF